MSVESIVKAINSVTKGPVGLHNPHFGELEADHLARCRRMNGQGVFFHLKLEKLLGDYCGVPYVVPTNSGTSSLHLALLVLGIKPDEEVIVPSLTFVATANAVRYVGAFPHFIDCSLVMTGENLRQYLEKNTKPAPDRKGRLNPKTNRVISAVIAVDLLGFPADLVELEAVASEFGLLLIEDAAQALGSSIGPRKCGSFGSAAIFSFNSNKIVTGHGGGALLTKDAKVAERARTLSTTARVDHPWKVENTEVAYNYRMPTFSAAVICAQLERLPEFLVAKKHLRRKYGLALANEETVSVVEVVGGGACSNYWLTSITVRPPIQKDALLYELHQAGIKARALFTPLHRTFPDYPRETDMQSSIHWFERTVCLPSGVFLAWA